MSNEIDELKVRIFKLEDLIDKVVRRQDSIQKSLDLIYNDREILEDIQGSIRALHEVSLHSRQHVDNKVDDVKAEVREQGLKVEERVEKIKNSMEQNATDTIKTVEDNIGGLVQNIEKKKTIIVKEGLFTTFRKLLGGEIK